MGNRSLDEFTGAGDGDDPDEGGEAGDADPDPTPERGDAGPTPSGDGAGDDAGGEAGDDDEGTEEADAPSGENSADEGVAPEDTERVTPAETTYASGEGTCAACGTRVDERWQGEAGLVCPDCKEW